MHYSTKPHGKNMCVCKVLRGLNPSHMTLQGTNTYLIGDGKEKVLIDTGAGVEGYEAVLESCLHQDDIITDIIITHRHLGKIQSTPIHHYAYIYIY